MTLSDEALARLLEDRMLDHGVYVTDHTAVEGTLHVRYETDSLDEGVPKTEVGRLLAVLLEEGYVSEIYLSTLVLSTLRA